VLRGGHIVTVRLLTVAAATVLAAAALTACTPKAGAAAIVDDTRISTTEVGKYVTRSGPSPDAVAQAAQQDQQLLPKTTVVTYLVQQVVFARALAATRDGMPSDTVLNQLHDRAAQTLLGSSLTGASLDKYLFDNVGKSGFTDKFPGLVLHTVELEQALIDRLKASSIEDLAAAVQKTGVHVSVNPRYGTWSSEHLDVEDPSRAVPSFLTLVPAETTVPSTTAAG
jgi:hypothetical protein